MFCRNCGSMIQDNAKFCGRCGEAVSQSPIYKGASFPVPEERGKQRSSKISAFGVKVLAAVGAVAVVLLLIAAVIVGVNFGREERGAREEERYAEEEKPAIENLYGTWTDERQTLTLTFEENGTLRVADANNIIGVDLLKYRESGDNSLILSADQGGLLGMISIRMRYEFFGDQLLVEISGQEFSLKRK